MRRAKHGVNHRWRLLLALLVALFSTGGEALAYLHDAHVIRVDFECADLLSAGRPNREEALEQCNVESRKPFGRYSKRAWVFGAPGSFFVGAHLEKMRLTLPSVALVVLALLLTRASHRFARLICGCSALAVACALTFFAAERWAFGPGRSELPDLKRQAHFFFWSNTLMLLFSSVVVLLFVALATALRARELHPRSLDSL